MPAELIMANPAKSRAERARLAAAKFRLRGNPGKRAPSAAQLASQERFKRMVEARRGSRTKPRANPWGQTRRGYGRTNHQARVRRNDGRPSDASELLSSLPPMEAPVASKRKKSSKPKAAKKSKASKPKKARKARKSKAARKRKGPSKASIAKGKRTKAAKKAKRSAAARKAARTRKASSKPRRKRKGRKMPKGMRAAKAAVSRSRSAAKKARAAGKKVSKKARASARVQRARLAVWKVRSAPGTAALAKKYKLRSNPGGIMSGIMAVVPEVATVLISTGAAAYLGQQLTMRFAAKLPASIAMHAPAIFSAGAGVALYAVLQMVGSKMGKPKVGQLAPWALAGGFVAAMVHELAAMKGADGISYGKKLGLPLGDYVVGDYVMGSYHMGAMGEGNYHVGATMLTPDVAIQDGIFGGVGAIELDAARRQLAAPAEMQRHNTRRDAVDVAIGEDGIFGPNS